MIYQLIDVIYSSLSASFQFADKIFAAVGIALVTAVSMMVLVSTVLRLFSARFVGQQIVQGQERVEKREQEIANNDLDVKYSRYKTKRIENEYFKRRFRSETKSR